MERLLALSLAQNNREVIIALLAAGLILVIVSFVLIMLSYRKEKTEKAEEPAEEPVGEPEPDPVIEEEPVEEVLVAAIVEEEPAEEEPEEIIEEEPAEEEPEEIIDEEPVEEEPEEIIEEVPVEEEPEEIIEEEPVEEESEEIVEEEPAEEEPEEIVEEEPVEEIHREIKAYEVQELMQDDEAAALIEESERWSDKTKSGIVNIDTLSEYFTEGERVTLEEMKARIPVIPKKTTYIKVLARGKLDKALEVEADEFSLDAVKMIALMGGKAIRTRKK